MLAGTAVLTLVLVVVGVLVAPTNAVRLVILIAIFVPLERALALRSQPVLRRGMGTDAAYFFTNQLASIAVLAGLIGLGAAAADAVAPGFRENVAAQPAWLQIAGIVAVTGVPNYWVHRKLHEVPALWRFHAIHHSNKDLDWLAAVRVHPMETTLVGLATLLPLTVIGFDAEVLGLYALFFSLSMHFDHANTRIRIPVVRWIISTPEWHHWHHATDADAVGHNYAGFPLLDVVFGTAFLPSGRRPHGYGISDPVPVSGYVAQLVHPFRRAANRDGAPAQESTRASSIDANRDAEEHAKKLYPREASFLTRSTESTSGKRTGDPASAQ